jgi:hypothetical protein
MKSSILTFFLSLILGTTLAHGATYTVFPSQNLQVVVNAASNGDEIILNGAFFDENITISGKSLTIRKQNLIPQILRIKVENNSNPCLFEGIRIANLLDLNNSNVQLRNTTVAGLLVSENSDVHARNSTFSNNVNLNFSNLNAIKCNFSSNLSILHPNKIDGSTTKAFVLQSAINNRLTSKAAKSLIYYNTIRYSDISGIADITGNIINGGNGNGIGILLSGNLSKALIRNNRIYSFTASSSGGMSNTCIGIWVKNNAKAEIINNLIHDCYETDYRGTNTKVGVGIVIDSTKGTTILGNALWGCWSKGSSSLGHCLIRAPSSGVVVQYNSFFKSHGDQSTNYVQGGVVANDNIIGNPSLNGNGTLKADSPCINAGPPDPQYNDRDGSRNDIGMFGGHNFIPDGRTTNKPIVLGLDIAPIAVPTGGTVTIESTGATVK